MAAPIPLLCLTQDDATTILSNAGASATGQSYGVQPLRGTGALPAAIVAQVTGTPGAASFLQGSQDGTNWSALDSGTGTPLAAGFQKFNNVPAMIRAVTGTGALGLTVVVTLEV